MRLQDAVDRYCADLAERQCSQSHISSVETRLARFVGGHKAFPIEEVTTADIDAHFQALGASGLANGTLAGYKSTHRAFWNWCVKQGWVDSSPARVLSRRDHSYSFRPVNHQPADRADFDKVVRALPEFAAHRKYRRRDVRDALIVSLAIDSSARRGALWKLRVADMGRALERGQPAGPDGRQAYRVMVSDKTGARPVRFFDESAALVRRWLAMIPGEAVYLFCSLRSGKRLRPDYLCSAFKRVCAYVDVPAFSFQAVRKRVIMNVISTAGDAKMGQMMGGHTDERTTAVYYNLVQEEQVMAAAAAAASNSRGAPAADGDGLAQMFFRRPEGPQDKEAYAR